MEGFKKSEDNCTKTVARIMGVPALHLHTYIDLSGILLYSLMCYSCPESGLGLTMD